MTKLRVNHLNPPCSYLIVKIVFWSAIVCSLLGILFLYTGHPIATKTCVCAISLAYFAMLYLISKALPATGISGFEIGWLWVIGLGVLSLPVSLVATSGSLVYVGKAIGLAWTFSCIMLGFNIKKYYSGNLGILGKTIAYPSLILGGLELISVLAYGFSRIIYEDINLYIKYVHLYHAYASVSVIVAVASGLVLFYASLVVGLKLMNPKNVVPVVEESECAERVDEAIPEEAAI